MRKRCPHNTSSLQLIMTSCPVCQPSRRRWSAFIFNIMCWYIQALAKYAVFSGRACCRELWAFILINAGVIYALDWLVFPIVLESYIYFLLLPTLALWVRRLHDFNLRGWWLIPWLMAPIIIVIGAYYLEEIQFPIPANEDPEMLDQPFCCFYPLLAIMIACPLWLIAFLAFLSLPGAFDANSFGLDPRMAKKPKQ